MRPLLSGFVTTKMMISSFRYQLIIDGYGIDNFRFVRFLYMMKEGIRRQAVS